jgi:hypothetical protein
VAVGLAAFEFAADSDVGDYWVEMSVGRKAGWSAASFGCGE